MILLTVRFRHSRSHDVPWLIALTKRDLFKAQILSPKRTKR